MAAAVDGGAPRRPAAAARRAHHRRQRHRARARGEILAEATSVDAIAPSRVVPVRHAVVAPQTDRLDHQPAVVEPGPPRRAELPAVAVPAAPLGAGVNAAPAAVPENRGPPAVSAP
ncbi:hypothetical protein ACFQV2_21125 [Actinokineospora soli]|uniref:Uncharacterized protein n=1 Tax=Actinokineospora soli TaxID=1048753 RepID=A0ABW2TPA4_9PSEU